MKIKILTIEDHGPTFTVYVRQGDGPVKKIGLPAEMRNDEERIMEELRMHLKPKEKPATDWTKKFENKEMTL